MTAVVGHTISWDFVDSFRKWKDCPPSALFDAATKQFVSVGSLLNHRSIYYRWKKALMVKHSRNAKR